MNQTHAFILAITTPFALLVSAVADGSKPYRIVRVADLPVGFSSTAFKHFPAGEADGAIADVLRFRFDPEGNIVGTVVDAAGVPHGAVWSVASGQPRLARLLPTPGQGLGTVVTAVSRDGSRVRMGGGVMPIGGGLGTPRVWEVDISGSAPLLPVAQTWDSPIVGLVQALGPGEDPLVGGGARIATDCPHEPQATQPFLTHLSTGATFAPGVISEPCGAAASMQPVMRGSVYAVVGGLLPWGFGWRDCNACPMANAECQVHAGLFPYERFARWQTGSGMGAWQLVMPPSTFMSSRAVDAIQSAACGWATVMAEGDPFEAGGLACGSVHAQVMGIVGDDGYFVDIHGTITTHDQADASRVASRASAIVAAPPGWDSELLVAGSRGSLALTLPGNLDSDSRGILWQGTIGDDWCGKRAEALAVNLAVVSPSGPLEIHALHGLLDSGAAVGIAYLRSNDVPGAIWGQVGAKLVVMTHPADFNGDLRVRGDDLGVFLGAWGSGDAEFDLDASGSVSGSDLGILLQAYSPQGVMANIPKWECDKGEWFSVPVISAASSAALLFGFSDLEDFGDFLVAVPSEYSEQFVSGVADATRIFLGE